MNSVIFVIQYQTSDITMTMLTIESPCERRRPMLRGTDWNPGMCLEELHISTDLLDAYEAVNTSLESVELEVSF